MNIFIVIFLLSLVFIAAELLYKMKVPSFITRKVVHVGGASVCFMFPFFIELFIVIILGIIFFALLLYSKRKKLLSSVHDISEHSIGAILFPSGVVLTAIIFWPIDTQIFQGAMLVLGLSDGIGGVIGKKYGKKYYEISGRKTIEGSLTFLLITIIILLCYAHIFGIELDACYTIIIGAFLLTFVEAVFGKGWDNIFVPLTAGYVLYLII